MKHIASVAAWWCLLATILCKENLTTSLSSRQILPNNFKPPQVFKNANLLRNINLEKGYVRETVNVVIENVDAKEQDTFYFPFKAETVGHVGGFEVKDKKNPDVPVFKSEVVEYDTYSPTQFYRITLPTPLAAAAQQTLSISYNVFSSLSPLPATIGQQDKQYLLYTFSSYCPSAYSTQKQKTKLKFPSADIPDYTGEPDRDPKSFVYGPFENTPAGAEQEASVRYEFTKPLIYASLLERDVEVSQWGGNLASEERYWLTNKGADLAGQFSRVTWAATQYYNPPSSALKMLSVPLPVGSLNPYFVDDIGNVSTSRYRSNMREAMLELRPRYPIFGGWKYSFKIGWDANLKDFLRKLAKGDGHVLSVPFLEGPKTSEGVAYEKVHLRVILPEGATNVMYESPVSLVSSDISVHKTFMDTVGRPTLELVAMNVVDEARNKDVIVTYDYPFMAAYRKPIAIVAGIMAVFVTAWAVGRLDVSIAKPS